MKPLLLLSALLLSASLQAAVEVREFRDAAEETRYQALVAELRCPKCQNTNLAGSDAGLAADLKDRVYQLLREGRSDDEIRRYMTDRYGDFITYKPPLRAGTLLLWAGPGLLLVLVGIALFLRTGSRPVREKPLTPDEQARLQALLGNRREGDL